MKDFVLKNKFIILLISIIIVLTVSLFATCFGMEDYEQLDYSLGIVNTEYLNMRTGAGINFNSITVLEKNDYVRIFGKIGEWYIIQNEKNQIGTAHIDYITPTDEQKAAVSNTETIDSVSTLNLTEDENELLNLINAEREKNNLSAFKIDESLQNVARLKAQDLVENNYFSHISPTYGTPFEMLRNNQISYKTASENIAGNPSISGALDSWLNSDSHKKNILSNDYNYTGLAVVDSIAYGKIIVQLFVGK
ncbi:MAG: SCP-like extracellular protein [Clostridia bacterium]|nr:SCP-like extracellular protein [Clostridia bacterium]